MPHPSAPLQTVDASGGLYAGIDEAGRGPLAGPLAVAAVVFDPACPLPNGLNDSKQLTAARRNTLYETIIACAQAWHVVMIDVETIDRLNIFQATLQGMSQVIHQVCPPATAARIDGKHLPKALPCPAQALIGGDRRDPAIMAASILAKVQRDRYMQMLHDRHPQYHFDQHKGYATPAHRSALQRYGPCAEHRRSFSPVREALRAQDPPSKPVVCVSAKR